MSSSYINKIDNENVRGNKHIAAGYIRFFLGNKILGDEYNSEGAANIG
jgi:hypothetical protein